MSIKETLKPYLKDTLLWRVLRMVKSCLGTVRAYMMIFTAFCLGWCSYGKMKAYFREYNRVKRIKAINTCGKSLAINDYNGKRIIARDEANKIIGDAIEAGKPFMAGRYGSVELGATWIARDDGKGFMYPYRKQLAALCSNAGFFPEDKRMMLKFAEIMREATYQVNLMGVWFNLMEEWILKTYGNNPDYTRLGFLEPLFSSCPWSAKLEGKKVLVIHPFDKTIQAQYKKRELLFPGTNILPEFELITQRAVQTIACNKDERFATWFEALDYMFNEAMKKDFDVAIIGCGAYGFPLATKIKQAGKIAVHMGGSTQILFGIKGKRWEIMGMSDERWKKLLDNPAWVRPEEKPEGFKTIENGCYW